MNDNLFLPCLQKEFLTSTVRVCSFVVYHRHMDQIHPSFLQIFLACLFDERSRKTSDPVRIDPDGIYMSSLFDQPQNTLQVVLVQHGARIRDVCPLYNHSERFLF